MFGVFPALGALTAGRRTIHSVLMQESLFDRSAVDKYNYLVRLVNESSGEHERRHNKQLVEAHRSLSESCISSDAGRRQKVSSIVHAALDVGAPLELCSRKQLDHWTSQAVHQGVAVRASPLEFLPFDPDQTESAPRNQFWLALDGVTDPQNFGAVLRSATFLGLDGVLVCERGSAPLSPVVSKASAGAMEHVEVHYVRNLARALAGLRGQTWVTLGAAMAESSDEDTEEDEEVDRDEIEEDDEEPLSDHNMSTMPRCLDVGAYAHPAGQNLVLVLGSEGKGLRKTVRAQCEALVHIKPGLLSRGERSEGLGNSVESLRILNADTVESAMLDSLNVSVAGAILMYKLAEAVQEHVRPGKQ